MTQTFAVESADHLMKLASADSGVHVAIRLNGGIRSSKFISFNGKRFYILHEVDGAEQFLRPDALNEAGVLLDAIATGNCFAEYV